MNRIPLGSPQDGFERFPPDRVMAVLMFVLIAGRFGLTLGGLNLRWHEVQLTRPVSFPDYLLGSWSVHARYVVEVATKFWLAYGIAKGRRWAFMGLLLFSLAELGGSVHYFNFYGLFVVSIVAVYCGMRLCGSLGQKPRSEPSVSFRPDRAAATLDYVALGISLVATLRSTVAGYHHAQDMGAIAPLAYLSSKWWVHVRYLVEVFLEAWTIRAIDQSRKWAFLLMALLSTAWLFSPLRYLHWFYIVTNGAMLLYCSVRLFGGLGPKRPLEADIVSG